MPSHIFKITFLSEFLHILLYYIIIILIYHMPQESKTKKMELKSILMQTTPPNLLNSCLQNLGIYLSIRNCNLYLNRLIL